MGNLRVAPAPNRPSIGESLGPIGLIVRWLLRAESMPLALISGMLGFVLFGSAISPPEATSPPMSSASPERVAPQESSEPLPPAPPRTETPQQPSHPP